MSRTRIKICGITRPEDAVVAADAGADAIGLVFYPQSPRAVTAQQAAEIVAVVPAFVSIVALFVNEPAESIRRISHDVAIDLFQFHGDESPEFCRQFDRPWIKALRVREGMDIAAACGEYNGSRGILLDTYQKGVPGGTGQSFDWHLVSPELPTSVVLAGGLHHGNVAQAIATVKPAAVDVSGGVESKPGLKDREKINRFVAAVRTADSQWDG